MQLKGFPAKALNTFQIRTARSLGLGTRVTLNNGSHLFPGKERSYAVSVTAYSPDGKESKHYNAVDRLAPDEHKVVDCARFELSSKDDTVIIFHINPETIKSELLDIPIYEVLDLNKMQDHYLEYFKEKFAAGLLYLCWAVNTPQFSPGGSTIIQAPKIYLRSDWNALLSVMNISFNPGYNKVAKLKCRVVSESQEWQWIETIHPFQPVWIDIKARLIEKGHLFSERTEFFCLYALSEDVSLIPVMMNINERTGYFGLEHSLPPTYYGSKMSGPSRKQTLKELKDLTFAF
jgi:hypothetical protein